MRCVATEPRRPSLSFVCASRVSRSCHDAARSVTFLLSAVAVCCANMRLDIVRMRRRAAGQGLRVFTARGLFPSRALQTNRRLPDGRVHPAIAAQALSMTADGLGDDTSRRYRYMLASGALVSSVLHAGVALALLPEMLPQQARLTDRDITVTLALPTPNTQPSPLSP